MPKFHKVEQGDCLASIAAKYGFADYKTIWNDAKNEALRTKRKNPNILFPGDIVAIPDKATKTETRPAGASHSFASGSASTALRVVLTDFQDNPLACQKYTLQLTGQTITGTTKPNGLVEATIPSDADSGQLILEGETEPFTILLGQLDPIDTISGVQARLNNLGYDSGKVDNIQGPITTAALRAFQTDNSPLAVDGIYGPKTRAVLLDKYGC